MTTSIVGATAAGLGGITPTQAYRDLRKKFPSLMTKAEWKLRRQKEWLEEQIKHLESNGKSAAIQRRELANVYGNLNLFNSDPLYRATQAERQRYQQYLEVTRSSDFQLGLKLNSANLDLRDYQSETAAGLGKGRKYLESRTVRMADSSTADWLSVTDEIAKALGVSATDVPKLLVHNNGQAKGSNSKSSAQVIGPRQSSPTLPFAGISKPKAVNSPLGTPQSSSHTLNTFKKISRDAQASIDVDGPAPQTIAEIFGEPEPEKKSVRAAEQKVQVPKGGVGKTLSDLNTRAAYQFARNAKVHATKLAIILGKMRKGLVGRERMPELYALQNQIERYSRMSADAYAQVGELARQAELQRMGWEDWVISAITAPVSTIDAALAGITPKEFQTYAPEGGRFLAGLADIGGQMAIGALTGGTSFAARSAAIAMSAPMVANAAVETYTDGIGAGLKSLNPIQAFWEPGATWEDKSLAIINAGMMGYGAYQGLRSLRPRNRAVADIQKNFRVSAADAERFYNGSLAMLESGKARLPDMSLVRRQARELSKSEKEAGSQITMPGSRPTQASHSTAESFPFESVNRIIRNSTAERKFSANSKFIWQELIESVRQKDRSRFDALVKELGVSKKQRKALEARWNEWAGKDDHGDARPVKSAKYDDGDNRIDIDPEGRLIYADEKFEPHYAMGKIREQGVSGREAMLEFIDGQMGDMFAPMSQAKEIDLAVLRNMIEEMSEEVLENHFLVLVDRLSTHSGGKQRGLWTGYAPFEVPAGNGKLPGSSRSIYLSVKAAKEHGQPFAKTFAHEMAHDYEHLLSPKEVEMIAVSLGEQRGKLINKRLDRATRKIIDAHRIESVSEWWAHMAEDHVMLTRYMQAVLNSKNSRLMKAVYKLLISYERHLFKMRYGKHAKEIAGIYDQMSMRASQRRQSSIEHGK